MHVGVLDGAVDVGVDVTPVAESPDDWLLLEDEEDILDLDVDDVDEDRDVVEVSASHDEAVVRYDSVVVVVSVIVYVLSDDVPKISSESQLTELSTVTAALVTLLQEHALAYCVAAQLAVAYAGEGPTIVDVLYVTAGVLNCRRILALGSSGSLGSITVEIGSSVSVEDGSSSEDVERDEVSVGSGRPVSVDVVVKADERVVELTVPLLLNVEDVTVPVEHAAGTVDVS